MAFYIEWCRIHAKVRSEDDFLSFWPELDLMVLKVLEEILTFTGGRTNGRTDGRADGRTGGR